jgi:hypothetical protein
MAMPIAPVRMRADPRGDPRYQRVKSKLSAQSAALKKHPPAAKKANEPSKAAKGPPNEKAAGARANQVDKLDQAETPKPKPTSFLETLQAEIAKVMPKTLGDTEKFMKGGDGNAIKSSLKGNVAQEKNAATGDLKQASNTTPSESGVPAKPVTPIPPEAAAPTPQVDAAGAMPAPKTDAQISLQGSKEQVSEDLEKQKLTPQRLTAANDPRFSAVLPAQDKVNKQADAGPAKYRAAETATLAGAAGQAIGVARKGVVALLGAKKGSQTKVRTKQDEQKAKEERELQTFTTFVVTTFETTKKRVDKGLETLETTVNDMFDRGTDAALTDMKSYIEDQVFNYKLKRYLLMPFGALLWIKDQILELPDEVNRFFEAGRQRFTRAMNALAVQVASIVERQLAAAKAEVKAAQAAIARAQRALSPAVQARATAFASQYTEKFSDLEQSIEDKKQSLAEGLAQKYQEAFDKAAEVEKAIKEDNKGLVAQAKDKIAEVAKALAEFKDRLMGVLRKGADTIELILKDPMQFLSNLLSAIKGGFNQFAGNILTHLKAGFVKWLFGALASAGIEIPSDLTVVSVLKLVLGVLGITYASMRAKAVKLLGPTAVAIIEKLVEYVEVLIKGGPAALWEKIKEDLSNLKEMVIDAIQNWIITTIVKKAVAKIVSMFNPAGAIIQAVLMIISVVQFVIERAAQIMEFVESVINSIHAIATGAIGGAMNWIEKSLANMIPILIGFLAALVGLGGLAAKIKGFILKVQSKVDKAIDKVLKKIIDTVKKLFGKVKAAAKKLVEWWKKKKRFKAADESHELSFKGTESNAVLMIASNPQAVEDFVKGVMASSPTDDQKKAAGAITPLLGQIKTEMKKKPDKQDAAVITGLFDSIAAQLAILMELGEDKETKGVKVPSRRAWEIETLEILQTRQPEEHRKKLGAAGQPVVKKGKARRHIVSSKDMAEHYENVLNKKKWSLAKALLEKGGSGKAHTKVEGGKKLNNARILESAQARHSKFFNHADNLFVGPGKKNSALGRRFDPDKGTGMTDQEIKDYVDGVKKEWALDGSFAPTR